MRRAIALATTWIALLVPLVGHAEIVPVGPAFDIAHPGQNTYARTVAVRDDGRFVVGWHQPGIGKVVRVFEPNGSPRSDVITISSVAGSPAQVLFTSPERFVVVWNDDTPTGLVQVFTADGVGLGPATSVSGSGAIAANPDGSMVLLFGTPEHFSAGFVVSELYTLPLDPDGHPTAAPLLVAPDGDLSLKNASFGLIARGPAGLLMTWTTFFKVCALNCHTYGYQSWARTLDPTGHPSGPAQPGDLALSLAAFGEDHFAIGEDETPDGNVWARVLGADGQVSGPAFQVTTTGPNFLQDIAANASAMVAAWQRAENPNPLLVRAFDQQGEPAGDEVELDTEASGAVLAMTPSGRIVAVWLHHDTTNHDYTVRARFAQLQVQCTDADGDGFAAEGGSCGPADCADDDGAVNPGATEIPGDGIDNDCNPATPGGCSPEIAAAATPGTPATRTMARLPMDLAAPMGALWGLAYVMRRARSAARRLSMRG